MRESFKVAVITFLIVLFPITIWNGIELLVANSCDPKFGCLGTFKFMTLIASICAFITALGVSLAHYLFCKDKRQSLRGLTSSALILLCLLMSFISSQSISLAERLGVPLFISLWLFLTFTLAYFLFKTASKRTQADSRV